MIREIDIYLQPTAFIDCNDFDIINTAKNITLNEDVINYKIKRLFYFVRDEIKYDIVIDILNPYAFKASSTLKRKYGLCFHKAILLSALSRAIGVPSVLCFAKIKNYLLVDYLREFMEGGDIVLTCYTGFYINNKWIKASPMYDLETCEKQEYVPVEFDGINDAMLPLYDKKGRIHIEYLKYYDCFEDFQFNLVEKYFDKLCTF